MSEEILKDYIEYLSEEKNLTINTLNAYIRDVKLFREYLISKEINEFIKVNKTIVITYLMDLQKKGRATSTISRNLASIRSFYQYLLNSDKIKEDPTFNLKAPKIEKNIPDILTIDEMNKILSQPNINNFKGARDKAMLELLYATGLKVSEIIYLNTEDLDLNIGMASVKDSQNIERVIPIGKKVMEALLFYIENYRKNEKYSFEKALFINFSGKRLSRQGIWKIIKIYGEKTNINKKITPDIIRHSFAAHLIENGVNLNGLQEILGYSELSSTQIYSFLEKYKILRQAYKEV